MIGTISPPRLLVEYRFIQEDEVLGDELPHLMLDWLARPDNIDWLLIFDNVDLDYEQDGSTGAYDVRRYLLGDHGSVLVTTRLARLAQLGDSKPLKKVDGELSEAIFEKWYGKKLGRSCAAYEFGLKLTGRSHGRDRQRATRSVRRPATGAGASGLVSSRNTSGLRAAKHRDDVDDIIQGD